jgi:hypothetical protein
MRDPVLTGGTSLTRAVLIAIMVASVGFGAIQFKAVLSGVPYREIFPRPAFIR